jgi:hypothetical protein
LLPAELKSFNVSIVENDEMATREKRLAQFDGNGEPPADQLVEVLCEDHSGTYQLPFACRFIDGQWRNHESGGAVEATVIAWRLPRVKHAGVAWHAANVPKCDDGELAS